MGDKFDEIFATFDLDGSGKISVAELSKFLEVLHEAKVFELPTTDFQGLAEKMIDAADKNDDNTLTKEELRTVMGNVCS